MNATDIAMIVFCILIVGVFVVGIVNKARTNGVKSIFDEESMIIVKKILVDCIGEILEKVGVTGTYDEYKEKVLKEVLKKVRAYIDEKGGLVDTITDEISDDQIIDLIDEALQLSGMEDDVKKTFDALVKKRVDEIEQGEDEDAAAVDDEGFVEGVEEEKEHFDPNLEPEVVDTDE